MRVWMSHMSYAVLCCGIVICYLQHRWQQCTAKWYLDSDFFFDTACLSALLDSAAFRHAH